MKINRKKFFDGFKDRIDPTLEQGQVNGLEFLLGRFEGDVIWSDVRHVAYALATIFHETAFSFQPVEEGYYLGSKAKAFQKKLRYYPYFGRGYVQLTWKTNYAKAGKALDIDLVNQPEKALDKNVAFDCLTLGLFRGWYGAQLTSHINNTKTDYVNARRCVNVLDKAGLIAGYAKSFEKILRASISGEDNNTQTATSSTPTDDGQVPPKTTDELAETSSPEHTEIIQNADTIINEESLMDKANKAGDKLQSVQGTLDKFGFSIEDAKRSIGTVVLTYAKYIGGLVMLGLSYALNHWEYILIAVLLFVLAYLLWDRSGKRVAEAKAGVPKDIAEKLIEQK